MSWHRTRCPSFISKWTASRLPRDSLVHCLGDSSHALGALPNAVGLCRIPIGRSRIRIGERYVPGRRPTALARSVRALCRSRRWPVVLRDNGAGKASLPTRRAAASSGRVCQSCSATPGTRDPGPRFRWTCPISEWVTPYSRLGSVTKAVGPLSLAASPSPTLPFHLTTPVGRSHLAVSSTGRMWVTTLHAQGEGPKRPPCVSDRRFVTILPCGQEKRMSYRGWRLCIG